MDGGVAYDELDELYDVWCAEVEEDVPFYLGLAASLAAELDRDSLDVVELGAGSGRITVPLAAMGHGVRALDASARQLDRLGAAARDAGVDDRITGTLGDMRMADAAFDAESADLVLVPFRGLLHVTKERDAVLFAAAKILRPGGVLAFDVFHATPDQVAHVDGRWIHRRSQATATGRWSFDERATYRPAPAGDPGDETLLDVDVRCTWQSRRRVSRRIDATLPDDPPEARRTASTTLHLRLVPADTWRASLERTGFTIDGAYGWFDARPLVPGDDDSIWVARRD